MALFESLVGIEAPKIGVHGFVAALREWQDGALTRADIVAEYGLDAGDDADLDFLKNTLAASAYQPKFVAVLEQVLVLGEEKRFGYEVKTTAVARINSVG